MVFIVIGFIGYFVIEKSHASNKFSYLTSYKFTSNNAEKLDVVLPRVF